MSHTIASMIDPIPEPYSESVDGPLSGPVLFDAVLEPHRSLSPRGFVVLMAAISIVCFGGGMVFMVAGAWPVMGFLGLDVAFIYIAFKANYRAARAYETVKLTPDVLLVERVTASGRRQRWQFQPYWLSVHIADPPESTSPLTLRSHGRALEIGRFLSPDERLDFADALRDALREARTTPPAPIVAAE